MKAITIEQGGGPDVMNVGAQPAPELHSENDVLVRVHAAGINPIDTKIRSAPDRFPVTLPYIPGCDAAGTIEQVGSRVTRFKAGDEVWFSQPAFNGRQGAYAEYVTVDSDLVSMKPDSCSFEAAAAAPLVLLTAWEALHDRAGIKKDDRVFINGGAGGVGHVAIQLAKQAGAKVCCCVSSDEKAELVSSLGADEVINYKTENVIEKVLAWTGGKGVDIALDTVGSDAQIQCLQVCRVYGDMVTLLAVEKDLDWGFARQRNIRISQELMLTPTMLELPGAKQHQAGILDQCAQLMEQGKLAIRVAQVFPLDQAAAAHRFLEQENLAGKVVLTVE